MCRGSSHVLPWSCHSMLKSPLIPDGCFLLGCPCCRVSPVQCVHVQVAHRTSFASGLCKPLAGTSSLASCHSREGVTTTVSLCLPGSTEIALRASAVLWLPTGTVTPTAEGWGTGNECCWEEGDQMLSFLPGHGVVEP